jgi:hypothetical protein
MRKSLLCSLIAASSLVAGTAFAGSYGSAENYASADDSSIASGWYVGAGVNHSATDTVDITTRDNVGLTTNSISVDTNDNGWSILAGKNITDSLAIEVQYAQYGDESAQDDVVNAINGTYSDMYSLGMVGVLKTPSWNGFSALAKGGIAYFNEDSTVSVATGASESSTYNGTNFTYGFGAQYDYNQFGLRFDWTRIEMTENDNVGDFIFAPDQYTLSLLYNFA